MQSKLKKTSKKIDKYSEKKEKFSQEVKNIENASLDIEKKIQNIEQKKIKKSEEITANKDNMEILENLTIDLKALDEKYEKQHTKIEKYRKNQDKSNKKIVKYEQILIDLNEKYQEIIKRQSSIESVSNKTIIKDKIFSDTEEGLNVEILELNKQIQEYQLSNENLKKKLEITEHEIMRLSKIEEDSKSGIK